jgi:hypothetical protein
VGKKPGQNKEDWNIKMTTNDLNDKDWQKLVKNLERGKCILMLGSDIPSDADNYTQPPLTTLLAHQLAELIKGRAKIFDSDDLPNVAYTYLTNRIGKRIDLEMAAEDFYRSYQNHTTKLHECLAQLPFNYCISVTADDLMINAFKKAGKAPTEAYYNFRHPGNQLKAVTMSVNAPLVYKLYGAITDSRSLVLTETDLLDFLGNVISGKPELPPTLTQIFSDAETSFLFIGFGFQRWYMRILLHLLRNQQIETPPWSLALEDTRFFSDPLLEQTALFFDHAHSIEFKHCSWNELAENMLKHFQKKQAAAQNPQEVSLPDDAPVIFLCHSSKDSETVGLLGEKLRKHGLNTWRDRDNLRGGDRWDSVIKHVIEKQIAYFLVLQTPDMLSPSESYFVKEINCALERQSKIWSEYLFILPAFFGGSTDQKLTELSHLNYFDLRNDQDLERLIKDIQDDKQKRLARKEQANAN